MGRYGFVSPAAVIHSGLQDMMKERALAQQQELENQQKAAELVLRQAADKRAAEAQAEALKTTAQNRVVTGAAALGRGGAADESMIADAAKAGLSGLFENAAPAAPAISQPVITEPDAEKRAGIYPGILQTTAPSVGDAAASPGKVARGTSTERAAAEKEANSVKAATLLHDVTDRKVATEKLLQAGISTADIDNLITTFMGKEKVIDTPMRWDPKDGKLEVLGDDGNWTPHKGPLPEHYKILNEKDPSAMGGGLSTKLFQDSTGTYLTKTDATGNTVMERVGGLRPFAGQAGQIIAGTSAVILGNNIAGMVNPDWVGPLKGRYNSLASAYTNTYGDPGFRFLEAQVSNYKNQAIKAITGAQMSEPEAIRIMKSLPDVTLPPETFLSRLTSFNSQLEQATQIAQMYGEGRKDEAFDLRMKIYGGHIDPSATQVNEETLKKTFPNIKVSVEDVKKSPTVAGTPGVFHATPGGGAAPTKPKGSKYQVTVN